MFDEMKDCPEKFKNNSLSLVSIPNFDKRSNSSVNKTKQWATHVLWSSEAEDNRLPEF